MTDFKEGAERSRAEVSGQFLLMQHRLDGAIIESLVATEDKLLDREEQNATLRLMVKKLESQLALAGIENDELKEELAELKKDPDARKKKE